MGNVRPIDNSRIAVRHIRRATAADEGAVEVLPGQWWAPALGQGIEGRQGWQSAQVERRVSDHGTLKGFAMPNGPGDDGQMHRDRFAVRTDADYRVGTEWVEFRDADTGRPLFVGSPDNARVDRSTVSLTGVDAAALLSGWREGKVAPWVPHAPQDVAEWYSQAPVQMFADDFTGSSGLHGWAPTTAGVATVTSTDAGVVLHAYGASTPQAIMTRILDGPDIGAGWELTVRLVAGQHGTGGGATIAVGGAAYYSPTVSLQLLWSNAGGGTDFRLGMTSRATPGGTVWSTTANSSPTPAGTEVELTIVSLDGWYVFLRDGQMVGQLRAGTDSHPGQVSFWSMVSDVTVISASLRRNRPFLRRGTPAADYRVAGAPTTGGLRGDYFITTSEWAAAKVTGLGDTVGLQRYGAMVPAPLAEAYERRLDPAINFYSSPPTWMPPGPPNGKGFAVRWSGSVYLDLEASDHRLQIANCDAMGRVWVGDTTAGQQYLNLWGQWGTYTQAGVSLRTHLGTTKSGWYPIVIEYAQAAGSNGGGIQLNSSTNGVTWTVVPASKLSPYGCWEGDLGNESYREALDGVSTAMGFLWRVQPMTLESGEFPGRLDVGARLGQDTDLVIGEDTATEYASEVAATETVDRIVADAAGLGDNLGREGLTAELVDPEAPGRPWVTSRYESLGEITEKTMLQQRMSSLLALYGAPMETVAARPRGHDELVDSFPTTGAAKLMLWEPDDGVRLDLPPVGVLDQTPRRMTSVTWPLTPDGRGAPSVGFRQRTRHLRAVLQRLTRQAAVSRRHYQGQLTQITGSLGSIGSGQGGVDVYSRLALQGARVAKVVARFSVLTGTTPGNLYVNGVNIGIPVTAPGEYDITPWVQPGAEAVVVATTARSADTVYALQVVATVRV